MKQFDATAEEIAAAIKKHKGNIAAVARKFGVARSTIYNRMAELPELQDARHDAREAMLDDAESVLYKKVLEGSTAELIFFLKTQGKTRGYVERSEQELSGSIDMNVKGYITVTPDDWDDDKSDSSL